MKIKENSAHRWMLISLCLLIGATVWLLWLALPGQGGGRMLWALLLSVPLALPLPAMWNKSRYAAVCCSLILTPYLVIALMEAVANPAARWVAIAAIVGICALTALLIVWLRAHKSAAAA